jgi:hypothetical protein
VGCLVLFFEFVCLTVKAVAKPAVKAAVVEEAPDVVTTLKVMKLEHKEEPRTDCNHLKAIDVEAVLRGALFVVCGRECVFLVL